MFKLLKDTTEIKWNDRRNIKPGCVIDDRDRFPELIAEFEKLEEARQELEKYQSTISCLPSPLGTMYSVTEYYIEDEDFDIHDFSKMLIAVNDIETHETIKEFDNFEEAEDYVDAYYAQDVDNKHEINIAF